MTRSRAIATTATAATLVLSLGIAACGGSDNSATAAAPAPASTSGGATVGTSSAGSLGTILVDAQGNTLYVFDNDTGTQSTCSGSCATNWPPLRADGKPTAGTGANASMLGTTPRSDGKPQVTYNGHPVYTFSGDQGAGQTNGQGVTAFGAPWYVISPAGSQVTTSSSTSSSSSGSATPSY
jgi:predicted lipoprotein with Yx(FWY)xxD motif